jgi:hypothetical protein
MSVCLVGRFAGAAATLLALQVGAAWGPWCWEKKKEQGGKALLFVKKV